MDMEPPFNGSLIQPTPRPQLVDAALPLLRLAGDLVGEAVAMHGLVGSTQEARR